MKFAFFDIETDGLLETVSSFHCGVIRYSDGDNETVCYTAQEMYKTLENLIENGYILVGHNIIRYDYPALNKLLESSSGTLSDKYISNSIDTLPLGWHILTERAESNQSFGLEALGEFLGIPKPEITDWENLSIEEYVHRCREDVKITKKLFSYLCVRLIQLYPDSKKLLSYTSYLNFKMECIRYQEEKKIKLDVSAAEKHLEEVSKQELQQKESLEAILPEIPVYSTSNFPKKVLLNSHRPALTSHAERYIRGFLEKDNKINPETMQVSFKSGSKKPNAGSHAQIKDFLFGLGWQPDVYKTNDKGELIPQISNEDREVSESVKALYSKEPRLKNLEGIYMLSHRAGVFKGFLTNKDENERISPSIKGLTSTLRFKHRNIVNLPGVGKPWGEEIRGVLVKDNPNKLFIGCDMVAIEDMTKQHFMYFFDPEYVDTMRSPGFDPHLDLAVKAGFLTQDQADAHKAKTEDHTEQRQRAKRANYACTYGAGAPKLSSSIGISLQEAKTLHTAYWDRNKAITQIADSAKKIRLRDNSLWVQNPISGFWIPVRTEKDTFSSLNQSSGVYIFDRFIFHLRKMGIKPIFQYHDEIVLEINKWDKELTCDKLDLAIKLVNEEVRLNIELKIDYKSGDNYAQIH